MKLTLAKINCDGEWKVVHDDFPSEKVEKYLLFLFTS